MYGKINKHIHKQSNYLYALSLLRYYYLNNNFISLFYFVVSTISIGHQELNTFEFLQFFKKTYPHFPHPLHDVIIFKINELETIKIEAL